MACGCAVIGYDGFAGREFLRPPHAEPVLDGDVIAFARSVEAFLRSYNERQGEVRQTAAAASRCILASYSIDRERQDVLGAYRAVLEASSPGRAGARLRTGDLYVEGRRPPTGVRSLLDPVARRFVGRLRGADG